VYELSDCIKPRVDSKASSRAAVDHESVCLLRREQIEHIIDMLHSVVVTSEGNIAAIDLDWAFNIALVACPIAVDEKEPIPIVEVDVLVIVAREEKAKIHDW